VSTNAKPGPPQSKPPTPAPPPPPGWRRWLPWIGLLATLLVLWLWPLGASSSHSVTLNYSQFVARVDAGKVKTVDIAANGGLSGTLTNGDGFTSAAPTAVPDNNLVSTLENHHVAIKAVPAPTSDWLGVLISFLPLLLFVGWFVWLGRAARKGGGALGGLGGLTSLGRSKAKLITGDRPSTTFADVAGYDGVKQEITEVVDYLRDPTLYQRAGAVGPKGVLLAGPPGTGKTLLARAVAGEAQVPFFAVTGSSFVEMFVGVGAARVRDLFMEARKRAPAIVFIDEVDAIGQRRMSGVTPGGNDEREQTLNQMLAEMDGFEPGEGVVVLAATNRPEILDPALLRPGRFDRQITVPLPGLRERRAILAVHCRNKQLDPSADLDTVARGTPGFSGADLANLANEAAIVAVRDSRQVIKGSDFEEARDRVILGQRQSPNALRPDEKRVVAVHEAGHALVAALCPRADPVSKVTILPAGQALGVTEQLPLDERHLYGEGYLNDTLAVRLGGRAAELEVVGEGSSGAANDLAGATQIATHMVRDFGLSKRIGPVGYDTGQPSYLGPDQLGRHPYSEDTQMLVDREVSRLLQEAEQRATELLRGHREELIQLADLLVEQETVDGAAVYALVGRKQPVNVPEEAVVAPAEVHASGTELRGAERHQG
jgi:cell division protease FtsH